MSYPPDYENLLLEQDGDWLTIWFNRPEARNALSAELVKELRTLLEAVSQDRGVRGITLRGKGGVFCAGGDLKGLKTSQGGGSKFEDITQANRQGGELFDRVNSMPQVMVMLVEGAAIAGGLGILCCGDVVAVTADAKFALTETRLGISPAQIAPFVVERLGLRTARRLMLTGARFTGAEAGDLGVADQVVANVAELEDFEAVIRKQVRKCAPGANAVTKEIILATRHLDREAMLEFSARGFAHCMLSDEGREGIAAFVEKRKPSWSEPVSEAETSR